MTGGQWRRLGHVLVLVLGVAGVAQWWAGLAPLSLLAASYLAILGLLARALPLRIAAPGALLVQHTVLLVLVLVVPVVLGGPLRPGVALGILLVPCLAVLPDGLVARGGGGDLVRVPWPTVLAGATGGAVMVVTVVVAARGDDLGIAAWSASGDARLHLLFSRMILEEGGLHGEPLRYQPEYQDSLTALLLDTHGRAMLARGELLEHDLRGLGQLSTGMTVLWTLASTAALTGLGALRGRAAWAVVAVASVLPLTGLGLGVLLRDGFLPILLLVPLVLCSMSVLAWLFTTERSGTPVTVAVGASAAALPVLAFTWTPVAVAVGAASLPVWLRTVRPGEQRPWRLVLMVLGSGSAAAYTLFVLTHTEGFVQINGSITAPAPVIGLLVPLVVLLVALGGWSAIPFRAFTPYFVGTIAAAGITAYAVWVQPAGLPWNYFPSKVAWIWVLVGVPLLLVPFAHPRAGAGRRSRVIAGALCVLLGVSSLSPLTAPVLPHALGWLDGGRAPTPTLSTWEQPDVAALRLAVRLGAGRTRYVVYRVVPEEDRITNFWLAAHEPYGELGDDSRFVGWAYGETGTAADICALLALQPDRVVATADPAAEAELGAQCGRPVEVRLVRAAASSG